MEIIQEIWGFTSDDESGEAVVLYTVKNEQGASMQVTNMGAALVSVVVPDRDGEMGDVVAASAPLLVNRIWESRVEGNRIIFSIVAADRNGLLAAETAYHFSDDNAVEIVCAVEYTPDAKIDADANTDAAANATPRTIDFAPRTKFNLLEKDICFEIPGWQKNILSEAGTIVDEKTGRRMTILTSLPRICVHGSDNTGNNNGGNNATTEDNIAANERQIQKTVYRFTT